MEAKILFWQKPTRSTRKPLAIQQPHLIYETFFNRLMELKRIGRNGEQIFNENAIIKTVGRIKCQHSNVNVK